MIKKIIAFSLILAIIITCSNCSPAKKLQTDIAIDSSKGLKDYFTNYFPIGVAVSYNALRGNEGILVAKHFNSVTPENAMKMGSIHPEENRYNFREADSIVAFAVLNHMKVRGHTLCWHNQTPPWIFKNADGTAVGRDVLLKRLKEHITTVVNRYKGKVYAWDVVNEAISDKKDEYLRPSPWLTIIGEDYIAKAFEYAHTADPNAVLFYNDYNEISPVKRDKICRLVKNLKDAGVPINAIGLQAHWAINEPSYQQLDSTLQQFSSLKLTMQVTEMDISVYNKEHNARDRQLEDNNTAFTKDKENGQIDMYKRCFLLFKKYRKNLSGITFWNISDKYSWLDNFPVKNRKDYPLLFDKNLGPKKVFWEVVKNL